MIIKQYLNCLLKCLFHLFLDFSFFAFSLQTFLNYQSIICFFLYFLCRDYFRLGFSYVFWSYLLVYTIVLKCNIKFELQQNQKLISAEMTQNVDANKQSLISAQNNASVLQPPQHRTSEEFELTPLEKLLQKVGGQHTYQFKSFMIFNMMWFLTSWLLVGQGFFFDSTFQCNDYQQEQCQREICKLKPQEWSSQIHSHANSIVFAFEGNFMICSNDYLVPIMSSLLYLGSLIGFFVIPYIADNWGRKIAIKISWTLFIFGLIFIALADSPNMIAMGQFVSGFGCNPAITLCYSFINEQVLGSKRQRYGVVLQVFLAFGECIIAFMFLPKQNWKIVIYVLLALTIVNWLLLNYLVESPKFLIGRSKKQALKVLNQIAKINNKQPIQQSQMEALQSIDSEVNQGTSILDLFKYRSLRWATLGGGFVFMAIQVIYYGTLLNLDHIGYSKLINQEIIGVSQAAGYIACQLVISKIKRKKWSFIGLGVSAGLCFVLSLLTIIQNDDNRQLMELLQTGSLVLLRFVLCAFWALFYLYIAELYPTKVRSMGFGWASAVGTLGSAFAPYMIFGSDKIGINSWIAPGVFGLFGVGCIFCLSQTFGKPLYDDIEQVRLLGKWELSDNDDEQQDKNEDFPKTEEEGTTVLTYQ